MPSERRDRASRSGGARSRSPQSSSSSSSSGVMSTFGGSGSPCVSTSSPGDARQRSWQTAISSRQSPIRAPLRETRSDTSLPSGPAVCDPAAALARASSSSSANRSEEHTSELQSRLHLVCRLLLEKKNKKQ